ncbi:MAG: O-antigen ligase family protein [Tepidanaerobacteraceae bacterium]|jgi:O-antigen ligase
MNNVSTWIQNSLFISIITFLFRPEVWRGSFLYNGITTLSDFISKAFKGSLFRVFFTNTSWESHAIRQSRFMTIVEKINKPTKKLTDFLNNIIKNSYPFGIVSKTMESLIQSPLSTGAYIILPSMFSITLLKTIFESYTPKTFLYRIIFLMLLLLMFSVKVSLRSVLNSSEVWGLYKWFLDDSLSDTSSGKQSPVKELSYKDKLEFAANGIVWGALYYFLPVSAFIKLFGLIFISTSIYIWPGLGLALTAFMLPLAPTTYTVGIIGLTFISVLLDYNRLNNALPAAIVPALLFMASAGLAAVFSVMRAESIKTLPLYAAYFMIFYCASVLFRDKKTVKSVLLFLIISVFILSMIGIYQYFFVKVPTAEAWVDEKQFPELATRVYATLENPNVLGEYLGLAIPLLLALFWSSGKFRQKWLLAVVLGVLTLCLILTFSRGAWVGLAVSVFAFALLKEPRLLVLIVVLAILAPMFLPSVVTNRIASIGSLEDSSNAYRVTIWIAALRMTKDYWLNGVGLGLVAFSRVYRDYMIAGASAVHAHNLYLQVGLEMGIIGLFALLWMVFRGFSESLNCIENNHRLSFISAGIVAALAGHLFHGIFDYVWYSPRIVMAFWMYFGMMSAIANDNAVNTMTGEKV